VSLATSAVKPPIVQWHKVVSSLLPHNTLVEQTRKCAFTHTISKNLTGSNVSTERLGRRGIVFYRINLPRKLCTWYKILLSFIVKKNSLQSLTSGNVKSSKTFASSSLNITMRSLPASQLY